MLNYVCTALQLFIGLYVFVWTIHENVGNPGLWFDAIFPPFQVGFISFKSKL